MNQKTLQNYNTLELEIEQLEELITRVETRITEAKIPKMSQQPKGQGVASDTIGANLAHLEGLRDMYLKKRDELSSTITRIEHAIDELEPMERLIVRYRYITGLEWGEIAKKTGISERQVTRFHGNALQKIKNAP